MDPQRRLHLRQIHAVGTHFVNRENRLILRTDQPQQFKHIFSAFQQRMENPQRIALFPEESASVKAKTSLSAPLITVFSMSSAVIRSPLWAVVLAMSLTRLSSV